MFFGEMLLQNTLLFLAEKLLLYKFFVIVTVLCELSDCIYLHAVWVENCTDQIKAKISMRQANKACLA